MNYEGNIPKILVIKADGEYDSGDVNAAYKTLVKAAITDVEYASYPKGLADHYGCTYLAMVWGGITSWKHEFSGDDFPALNKKINTKQLYIDIKKLKEGQPPVIPDDCPLSIQDESAKLMK